MARIAAMKKVLSPISDARIMANDLATASANSRHAAGTTRASSSASGAHVGIFAAAAASLARANCPHPPALLASALAASPPVAARSEDASTMARRKMFKKRAAGPAATPAVARTGIISAPPRGKRSPGCSIFPPEKRGAGAGGAPDPSMAALLRAAARAWNYARHRPAAAAVGLVLAWPATLLSLSVLTLLAPVLVPAAVLAGGGLWCAPSPRPGGGDSESAHRAL